MLNYIAKLILLVIAILPSGLSSRELMYRNAVNSVNIATFSPSNPTELNWHSLELIPPPDGSSLSQTVTLSLDRKTFTVTCDGSQQTLVSTYPEIPIKVSCTLGEPDPNGIVNSVRVSFTIYDQTTYQNAWATSPQAVDSSLQNASCRAYTYDGTCELEETHRFKCQLTNQTYTSIPECEGSCIEEQNCLDFSSPYCETDPNGVLACKWQVLNDSNRLITSRGVTPGMWVVYSRTTGTVTLSFDVAISQLSEVSWCGVDVNGNGEIDQEEFAVCVKADNGSSLCPLQLTQCVASYGEPICPPGSSFNPEADRCVATPEIRCPEGSSYSQDLDRCTTPPACPGGGGFNPATDRCEIEGSSELCPQGFTWRADLKACVASPQCPQGGNYSQNLDKCVQSPSWNCPSGYTYNSSTKKCEASPQCPQGTSYSAQDDLCVANPTYTCPSGLTYNSTTKKCEANPSCPSGGTYNASLDKCTVQSSPSCPSGFTYNSSTGKCEASPQCPSGFTYSTQHDRCLQSATPTCPSGYTYNSSTGKCEASPQCPSGSSYNPSTNRCERSATYTCSLNGQNYPDYSSCTNACQQSGTCTPKQSCTTSYCKVIGFPICYSWNPSCPTNLCTSGSCCNLWGQLNSLPLCSNPPPGTKCAEGGVVCLGGEYTCLAAIFANTTCTTTGYTCSLNGQTYPTQAQCQQNCVQQGTCSATCPSGFTLSGSLCIANPTCPSGGSLNPTTDKCELTPTPSCPSGSTYDATIGQCVADATCPSGSSLNPTTDKCELTASQTCPSGYSYNSSSGLCEASAQCPSGSSLNGSTDKCEGSPSVSCPTGTSYNSGLGKCVANASCPSPGGLNPTTDKCEVAATATCSSGYSYNSSSGLCEATASCLYGTLSAAYDLCLVPAESVCPSPYSWTGEVCATSVICPSTFAYSKTLDLCVADASHLCPDGTTYNFTSRLCEAYPICLVGSYDPMHNACYEGDNLCPYGPQYTCVPYQGKNVCSPNPCYEGAEGLEDEGPENEGANDPKNDGTWTEEGECLGTVYVFSGKDMRCRTPGIETGWFNCCDGGDTWFGMGRCNQTEEMLAQLKKRGMCHKVGSYCSKKVLGVCVQKKATYCCFNSKLARIVHEQGRLQLQSFADNLWGQPKSPRCRGFTVQEFQMLDFERIDLSEWYGDIIVRSQQEIATDIQQRFTNYMNNLENQ